jgi:N-methylhydantoinase B/oxoprolinase/acetone carboxylase alpha subunit
MVDIKQNDIIIKQSSGGGGVGDPAERDPGMVLEDVINELVSIEAAREIYKVAINPETQMINQDETRKLRSS